MNVYPEADVTAVIEQESYDQNRTESYVTNQRLAISILLEQQYPEIYQVLKAQNIREMAERRRQQAEKRKESKV